MTTVQPLLVHGYEALFGNQFVLNGSRTPSGSITPPPLLPVTSVSDSTPKKHIFGWFHNIVTKYRNRKTRKEELNILIEEIYDSYRLATICSPTAEAYHHRKKRKLLFRLIRPQQENLDEQQLNFGTFVGRQYLKLVTLNELRSNVRDTYHQRLQQGIIKTRKSYSSATSESLFN